MCEISTCISAIRKRPYKVCLYPVGDMLRINIHWTDKPAEVFLIEVTQLNAVIDAFVEAL